MRLRTFGSLALEGTDFFRPKPLLLLAFLALEGSKSRRYLADLFYPHTRDPRDSLSSAIQLLKRKAGPVLRSDSDRISASVRCDASTAMTASERNEYRTVVEMYRGPFLDGLDLSLGAELEEWLFTTREILADRVRQALLGLAEAAAIRGRFEQAAEHARQAHSVPGAAEPTRRDLEAIHALLVAGMHPRAAAVHHEAEEFGIELVLTTDEARQRFQVAGDDAGLPPHNLPLSRTSFVGRDLDLIEIDRLLADPECRLLTLHGPGGVGKSRLADQAAREQLYRGHFGHGIYLIRLDPLTDAELIPASLAEILAIDPSDGGGALAGVQEFIGDREMLLLLDNYEHLIEAADLASELLARCPNLTILTTSRQRLNLEEEWVFEVEGLPVSPDGFVHPDGWDHGAPQLFLDRARRARVDFAATEEQLPYVLEICRLVEGLPLAIELAAASVKILSTAEIAREIGRNLAFLSTSTRNVPTRHRSVEAAFEYSWGLLPPRDRDALGKLSVFVGGFRRQHAAEAVGVTLPVLAGLEDRSLIRIDRNGRYDRHPLIHHFARAKLSADPEAERDALARHALLFREFVRDRARGLIDGDPATFTDLSDELDNIRAAWHSTGDDDILDFFWAFHPYQERRGLWQDALAWAERALEVAEPADRTEDIGRLLHIIGMLHRRFWKLDTAIDYLGRSLEIERAHGERADIASTHIEIGWGHYRLHRWQQATEHFGAAMAIADELQASALRADAHHGFGLVAQQQGRLDEAQEHLAIGWRLARAQSKNPAQLARITADFARYYRDAGDKQRCIELFEEAETIFEHLEDLSDLAMNHFEFAYALRIFGDYDPAREYFRKAMRLTETIDHRYLHQLSRLGLAETLLHEAKGDPAGERLQRARTLASDVLRYAESTRDISLEGLSARVLGEISIELERPDEAKSWLFRAMPLLEEVGNEQELRGIENALLLLEVENRSG